MSEDEIRKACADNAHYGNDNPKKLGQMCAPCAEYELRTIRARLAEAETKMRAEGMMDASWLIWENVTATAAGIKAIKASRAIIEAEAEKLWPGVKLPWQRAALARLSSARGE